MALFYRKTHEQFVEDLRKAKPDIEVIGEYLGSAVKIKFRCRIDGYEWSAKAGNVLTRSGCKRCAIRTLSKTHEQFVKELFEVDPNIEAVGTYVSSKTKLKFRCKLDGHEWENIPGDALRGFLCHKCSGRLRRTEKDYIEDLARLNPNVELISEYKNTTTKVKVRCKIDGYEWEVLANDLLHGHGCHKCSKTGYNQSKTGYFYTIMFGEYLGFGISNHPQDRLAKHAFTIGSLGLQHTVLDILCGSGSEVQKLETSLKRTLPIVDTGVNGFRTEAVLYSDRHLLYNAISDSSLIKVEVDKITRGVSNDPH